MIFGIFVSTKEQNIDMENKLNEHAIDDYVEQFSSVSLDQVFSDKDALTGEDILNLPLKQIGLFSLRAIFQSWHQESQNIRSPYFDYGHTAVQKSMDRLMNTLSNHISITRKDFEPIFKQAVRETIFLLFSPFRYYKGLVNDLSGTGNLLSELKQSRKFIKSNTKVLDNLIEKLKENAELGADALLDVVFQNISGGPDDIEESLLSFSAILNLNTDMLYQYKEEEDKEEIVDDLVDNSYFVAGEIATVNEQFSVEEKITLADTLGKNNKDSIKTMLTINQKFMFINDLFDGNQNDFVKVIDFLEDCETEEQAVSFIQNNYIKRSLWRAEAPPVKEFIKLIVSKYH